MTVIKVLGMQASRTARTAESWSHQGLELHG
jgi:hypothetical protein